MVTPSKFLYKISFFVCIFIRSFSARVVMIVQPGERNAFDQRWIEYTLLEE